MSPLRTILVSFFLVGSFQGQTEAVTVTGVLDIVKVAKDVIVALLKAWELVDQNVDFGEVPIPILQKTETKLFGKIERINSKLDDLAVRVDAVGTQSMNTILHNLPERVRLELRLNDLLDYMTRMETNYRRMQNYGTSQKDYEKLTLEDFAKSVISHDPGSVVNLLERIHAFVVPTGRGITNTGLFELVAKGMEALFLPFCLKFWELCGSLAKYNSLWCKTKDM